ncbi:MAG: hypothetical protein IJU94_06800 [Clostridia bacterium]|nr:hypothetical protein [Clostridia bacterium]
MTKTKSMKRALISSLLVMAMCFTMLVGTTFAWFTDSVTSAGNVIKSGTLDIAFQWADGTEAVADANWQDASQGAIFNYELWEPGYVSARHVRIANVGNLALKYKFAIQFNGELEVNDEGHTLADAIDVYYVDPAAQVTERTSLPAKIGALSAVLGSFDDTASGVLLPNDDDTVTIVLKMREEAGNEYQDMEIGASFSIQLLATQYTYENDSFDKLYDDGAVLPAVRTVTTAQVTNGAANFTANAAPVANEATTVTITGVAAAEDDNLTLSVATEGFEAASAAFAVAEDHTAVAGIDLTLEKNGTKVTFDNGSATVTTYILPGLDPAKVTVKYNGEGAQPTNVSYNAETGALTFTTTHFSEFYADYEGEFVYLEKTGRAYTDCDAFGYEVCALAEKEVDLSKIDTQSIIAEYAEYGYSNGHWAIATYLIGGSGKPGYVDSWKLDYTTNTSDELLAIMQEYYDAWDAIWDSIVMYPTLPDDGSVIRVWAPQQPMGMDIGEW